MIAFIVFLTQQLPAGWHRVEVSASVSVALPETAQPIEANSAKGFKLPAGEKLDHWEFIDGSASYVVGINTFTAKELSESPPDQILANSIRGSMTGLSAATIKEQRDIQLNGWPGIEFTLAGALTSSISRSFVIGRTMYQVLEVYPTRKGAPKNRETFLTSLSITPTPNHGPLKRPGPVFESFAPKAGKCSISMPGKAELYSKPAVDGSKPAFTQYVVEYGNRVYMLGYVDLPSEPANVATRQKIIAQMLLGFEGTKTDESTAQARGSVTFDRIFFTRPDGGIGRGEVAVVGHRAYATIMLYPPGHAGSPDIDTFFNSFKILEPPPKTK